MNVADPVIATDAQTGDLIMIAMLVAVVAFGVIWKIAHARLYPHRSTISSDPSHEHLETGFDEDTDEN